MKISKKKQNHYSNFFAFSLNEPYFNRIFAFMISTKSQTPKHEEKFKNLQNMTFLSIFKNGISQEISKADQMKSVCFRIASYFDTSQGIDLNQI